MNHFFFPNNDMSTREALVCAIDVLRARKTLHRASAAVRDLFEECEELIVSGSESNRGECY
jgi:hypothetical protein